MKLIFLLAVLSIPSLPLIAVVFESTRNPKVNRRIVLISGDEEYRSEEALPQLARILATRHGFH